MTAITDTPARESLAVTSDKVCADRAPIIITRNRDQSVVNQLLKETSREPFQGIGMPEPLRRALQGYWSRGIDGEYRLVYKVADEQLWIAGLRYHY